MGPPTSGDFRKRRAWLGLLRLTAAVVLICAVLPQLRAQLPERHLANPAAGELCRRSAYLHGYIHGYEEGFRIGDLDIHFSHQLRPLRELKEYREMVGYEADFGDRGFFQLGYREGFAAAYTDARRGSAFRGFAQLEQAAEGLSQSLPSGQEFDRAVAAGYSEGQRAADRVAENGALQAATAQCHAIGSHDVAYCDAYLRGFGVGYRDRYASQRHSETAQTARQPAAP
jgi:hypothetical protein